MSKFYVGQRVRVVAVQQDIFSHLIGKQGAVNELDCTSSLGHRGLVGVTIDSDSNWCFFSHQLEPLTDPGREVVSWETCEWKPEHLREVPA